MVISQNAAAGPAVSVTGASRTPRSGIVVS